jgi:hypothetical protein
MCQLKPFLIIAFILVLFASSCQSSEIVIPPPEASPTVTSSPITIDGTIFPGEWSQGSAFEFPDSSQLFLIKEAETLYLAVIGSRPGTLGGNIFLSREDKAQILHISAALGTAEYLRVGEGWSLERNFDWQNRTVGNGEAALEERKAYLEAEGWTAPNALTGVANHLEMQIELEPGTRIAVSLYRPGSQTMIVWPAGLEDDTGQVYSDGLPLTLFLETDKWFQIPE